MRRLEHEPKGSECVEARVQKLPINQMPHSFAGADSKTVPSSSWHGEVGMPTGMRNAGRVIIRIRYRANCHVSNGIPPYLPVHVADVN